MRIFLHSGVFHADDVFATVTLQTAYPEADQILRTRDPAQLAAATQTDFVVDVGSVYDAAQNRFDHHQVRATELTRPTTGQTTWPYAAFGLVWRHHGLKALQQLFPHAQRATLVKTWHNLDDNLVRWLDASDVGQRPANPNPTQLSRLIHNFNGHENDSDANFQRVLPIAREILHSTALTAYKTAIDEIQMQHLIECRDTSRAYLELPEFKNWLESVIAYNNNQENATIKYVLFPRPDGSWLAQSAPHPEDTFKPLFPFPDKWAAQKSQSLANLSGIPDAEFCHAGRHLFIGKSRASVIAATECAQLHDAKQQTEQQTEAPHVKGR